MSFLLDSDLPSVNAEDIRDYSSNACSEFSQWNRVPFWMAYRPYLESCGYTLYDMLLVHGNYVDQPWSTEPSNHSHPYAVVCYDPNKPTYEREPALQIAYAQDRLKRDVVIKLVQNNTEEYKIHRTLLRCKELCDADSFPSVIPTLDILPSPHDFSFVVTPRWGEDAELPSFQNVNEFLYFVHSLLKGLEFLHRRGIVHRDIHWRNILINHFSYGDRSSKVENESRSFHRASSQVRYALFDFNVSRIFLPQTPPRDRRLPFFDAYIGSTWLNPDDTEQGEADYDPFLHDVANMGNMLREVNYIVPFVPLLAPLLDGMTTHIISRRFTAHEALSFCEFICDSLSLHELQLSLPRDSVRSPIDDHWESLPKDFIVTWGSYRVPQPSFLTRVLRWLSRSRLEPLLRFFRRSLGI
ncbi:hypothetical protein K439DRAFT_1628319 [Ramaria rubella]|nr:hypothetical protein K439DRAFT_1628319 [Ramaria rubella]